MAISLAIRSRIILSNISRTRVFSSLQVDRPVSLCYTWPSLFVHQGRNGLRIGVRIKVAAPVAPPMQIAG
jgi:hypothetical protein